ncbi:hypothetical protein CVT26_010642 [Gymnopilus dilepis]|uniref:Uncharacterized protein n=1 Tax=Gymnopilus dilepis TaxID=231916 RepID=A0A409Y0X3_9AGAR|nr:hypothetical protein CVT26_010642 [Gymnopilus dilepis]
MIDLVDCSKVVINLTRVFHTFSKVNAYTYHHRHVNGTSKPYIADILQLIDARFQEVEFKTSDNSTGACNPDIEPLSNCFLGCRKSCKNNSGKERRKGKGESESTQAKEGGRHEESRICFRIVLGEASEGGQVVPFRQQWPLSLVSVPAHMCLAFGRSY